jgi:hypothetical protein
LIIRLQIEERRSKKRKRTNRKRTAHSRKSQEKGDELIFATKRERLKAGGGRSKRMKRGRCNISLSFPQEA